MLCLIRIFRDSYIAVKTVATFDGIASARESLSQTISLKIVAFSVATLLLQIGPPDSLGDIRSDSSDPLRDTSCSAECNGAGLQRKDWIHSPIFKV